MAELSIVDARMRFFPKTAMPMGNCWRSKDVSSPYVSLAVQVNGTFIFRTAVGGQDVSHEDVC